VHENEHENTHENTHENRIKQNIYASLDIESGYHAIAIMKMKDSFIFVDDSNPREHGHKNI
jgi:hypothetical protein